MSSENSNLGDAAESVELAELLAQGLAPIEPAPEQRAAMRDALLSRIRDDAAFVTIHRHEGHWQTLPGGIDLKVLHDHGDAQSFLLRLAPGARLAAHAHVTEELCVVLEGDVRIGEVEAGPGTYHLALAATAHHDLTTRDGCVLFLRANLDHAFQPHT